MGFSEHKTENLLIGLPTFVWLILFFVIPVLLIIFVTFKPVDSYGNMTEGWSLNAFYAVCSSPSYLEIIWRTVWQATVSTSACILIAIPVSYYIARLGEKARSIILSLIMVPFWTNFLIRIYAWKVFLHPDGFFKKLLVLMGLMHPDTLLLYNHWAVLAVMIYTYIPFAVLPVYAVAEKFDFTLLDVAKDFGASSFYAFRHIFLPAISKGVWTAVFVVLIPAFGAYLIPDLVGGPGSQLLGDKIAQRVFVDRNLPHASALSLFLMLGVFLPLLLWLLYRSSHQKSEAEVKKNV